MASQRTMVTGTVEPRQRPMQSSRTDLEEVDSPQTATSAPRATSTPSRFSKTVVNFVLDATLLVLVVLLLFSAAVLRFVFPVPTTSAGWTLWGYGYDGWANLQFALVTVLGLAILLHVMLHWSWVCGVAMTKLLKRPPRNTKMDDGQQTLWGVGLLIVIVNVLGLFIGLAYLMVHAPK